MAGAGYVGWNIGANDTANCIGTTIGCGFMSFRNAVIIVAFFSILGAVWEGERVMMTIGRGIVQTELPPAAVITILFCSGFWVTMATVYRMPVSTSQAVVGGVIGVGLASRAAIDYGMLVSILQSWVLSPLFALFLSFIMCFFLSRILRHPKTKGLINRNALAYLTVISGSYVSYSMGANNAGNAVGPLASLGVLDNSTLLLIGGASIALGAITYGKKVTETIGKDITYLDEVAAFCAQIGAAISIHLFTVWGIPVSTTAAIVGGVIGVGLTRGATAVRTGTVVQIIVGWIATPAMAALTSFLMYAVIRSFAV